MCAKMRRGALNQALLELGCNKVALGHHYDDAVETFFLSLFYEGRLSCFQPVTNLDRTGVIQIRPMLYLSEKDHCPLRGKKNGFRWSTTPARRTKTPRGRRSRTWSMSFLPGIRI